MIRYKKWITAEASRILSGTYKGPPGGSECIKMSPNDRMAALRGFVMKYENDVDYSGGASAPQAIFENCVELVLGERSSLDILMEDEQLRKYYECLDTGSLCFEFLQLLGNTNPSLRILEIGAGTGTETRNFLDGLKSPEGVLHATPSLKTTLQNVHKLLSPNGKMLLHEMCPDKLWKKFGVLPGWWIGKDDKRADRPYVTPERWDFELRAAGFTGREAFAQDLEQPFHHNFTMISGISVDVPTQKRNIFLISNNNPSTWASDVASQMNKMAIPWNGPFLYNLDEKTFDRLLYYIQKVENSRIIWVTHASQLRCNDPRYGLKLGFSRNLRRELGIDISIFETDAFDKPAASSSCLVYDKISNSRDLGKSNLEYEYSYSQSSVQVGRCYWGGKLSGHEVISPQQTGRDIRKLDIGSTGLLDTMHWTPCSEEKLEKDQLEIDMRNIDLMVTMGLVGHKNQIGFEGSGVVRRVGSAVQDFCPGDRVIPCYKGIFKTRITISSKRCWSIPDELSLIDAASMATVYVTAVYSLIELGNLQKDQIFATVGSEEKVQYLMENFGIPRSHIFNSRNSGFLPDLLRETNGRGADIVLNSLAGELLHTSWECVANRGKMIELGKRDFLTNGTLKMAPFLRNRAFYGVDIMSLTEESPQFVQKMLLHAMDLWEQGKIEPIRPVNIFPANQVVDAFRYMQQGVHMGKIVIELPEDVNELQISNSTVAGSVTKLSDVQNAVSKCIKPLAGVFQLSVKLTDRTFQKMKFEDWTSALAPKVSGTWNLHCAVEKENLDFFVVFGSLAGVVGNTGQINYSAANTFLDSFTQYRRNLGVLGNCAGPVGSYLLDKGEVIQGLKAAIDLSAVKRVGQNASVIIGLTPSKFSSNSTIRHDWETEARYSLHHNIESAEDVGTQSKSDNLRALIARAEENPAILEDPETEVFICREIGQLLTQHMANAEDMDDKQIALVAIDSLMSIEIRGWIRRNLGLEISLAEITEAGTVGSLATLAIEHFRAKYRKP
ncbi:KR-domain-containing protein [Penicillium longicatenatum]|nr:KR-domain-containing protein [Penicillium longicatenatum]